MRQGTEYALDTDVFYMWVWVHNVCPYAYVKIYIFRCSYFAGVLRSKQCVCVYTEVMAQDERVTFE